MNAVQQLMAGDRGDALTKRIHRVAQALSYAYEGNIPADDLEQEMWLALMERAEDSAFLGRPDPEIVRKLAWCAKDFARREFRYQNQTLHAPDPDMTWEFFGASLVEVDDPYPNVDARLTAIQVIQATIQMLGGRTVEIATLLMQGHSKVETATRLDISPATVTYHLGKIRTAVLSQSVVC
jgi:DNA-directed RNA polymerase specialized sigma24 family protein